MLDGVLAYSGCWLSSAGGRCLAPCGISAQAPVICRYRECKVNGTVALPLALQSWSVDRVTIDVRYDSVHGADTSSYAAQVWDTMLGAAVSRYLFA